MPVTILIEPDLRGERATTIAGLVRLARRLGEVAVLTSSEDAPSADALADAESAAPFATRTPSADDVARVVAAYCRDNTDVEHVLLLDGSAIGDRWSKAALAPYRALPRRPRTVLVLAGALPRPASLVAARLSGTVHRVVALVDPGRPAPRGVVAAHRPRAGDDTAAAEVFYATIIGTPPYYTNPLTPLKYVGARINGKLRREAMRRMVTPTGGTDLVRIGSDYGGWWVPAAVLRPGAVAYCAGAGEDITFDLALHERGLVVRTLDPTPRAITYVAEVGPKSDTFRFLPVGLWSHTDELKFFAPSDGTSVSHSAVNLGGTSEHFLAPVRSLAEVVADVGDDHVDLLKLDIEGAEYRVIDSILERGPAPDVLCIEFDQPAPLRKVATAVRKLAGGGYALDRIDGWNFTFSRAAS